MTNETYFFSDIDSAGIVEEMPVAELKELGSTINSILNALDKNFIDRNSRIDLDAARDALLERIKFHAKWYGPGQAFFQNMLTEIA